MKLVFLSDLHATAAITRPQRSLLTWLGAELERERADTEIFGGDLLQESDPAAFEALLACLPDSASGARRCWLPGNRDAGIGELLKDAGQRLGTFRLLRDGRSQVLLLDTETPEHAIAGFEALRDGFSGDRPVLVASHRSPDELLAHLGSAMETLSASASRKPLWVFGHHHKRQEYERCGWRCVCTPGLDAARVIAARPEYLVLEIGDAGWTFRRVVAPESALFPVTQRRIRIGIAALAPLAELFTQALANRIGAVQVRASLLKDPLASAEDEAIRAWRGEVQSPCLSVHLPNVDPSKEDAVAKLDPFLGWGKRHGALDYTLHLPDRWLVHEFFTPEGGLAGPRAMHALGVYADIAARVIASGAQLSLENIHNDANQEETGQADYLSTRPWHLRLFIEHLRQELVGCGLDSTKAARAGMIFDVGHARNNGTVTKSLAPLNWIPEMGGLIQALHIHQVRPTGKGLKNHCAIDPLEGPLINYEGIMACMASEPGPDCPAFIEVRGIEDAVRSCETLRRLSFLEG